MLACLVQKGDDMGNKNLIIVRGTKQTDELYSTGWVRGRGGNLGDDTSTVLRTCCYTCDLSLRHLLGNLSCLGTVQYIHHDI